MGLYRHPESKFWWYSFRSNGRRCRRSTGTTIAEEASEVEARAREDAKQPTEQLQIRTDPPRTWTKVYLVRRGGMVKVGKSDDPAARLQDLQNGCPDTLSLELVIPAEQRLERELHKALRRHHVRGEWFRDSLAFRGDLADALDRYADSLG